MEYISGKTLYELGAKPNIKEIKFLARQAAKINLIKIKPVFVYDTFAIINFLKEFKKTKKLFSASDLKLIASIGKRI